MSRPALPPPFPCSPETWLAFFRHKAEATLGIHLSPDTLGEKLGVSGATVRRWEKGTALPTDEDLVRFGALCGLDHQQIAFLRVVFTGRQPPLPPEPACFEVNTQALLTSQPVPMILLDELMYVRAWNSYTAVLGEHVSLLLDVQRHPLECFFDAVEAGAIDRSECASRGWKALRTFWRFTAQHSITFEYADLLTRFHAHPEFASLWTRLADNDDQSAIEMKGLAELLLPSSEVRFTVVHGIYSYPPMYSLFAFHPADDEAVRRLHEATSHGEPTVFFSNEDHWTKVAGSRLADDLVMSH